MYHAMKRFEIQVLRAAGTPRGEVTALAGVSEQTVRRVEREEAIEDPARNDATRRARMGRPSKLAPFLDRVREWLEAESTLPSAVLFERLREGGCTAGKSAVYESVARLRPKAAPELLSRFEAVPGEFSQHDFGEVLVTYLDGTQERVHFFASRLKYSRLTHVRLTPDQRTETICHSLAEAFTCLGGVPLMAVFDNPRTIVLERDGLEVKWQPTFASFCVEVGIVPRVTWPYRPQEKGAVENLVGFVKGAFFKARRFRDRAHLEAELRAWLVHVNEERPSRATGETPGARHLLERPRLRPLLVPEEGFRLKWTRLVRTDGFVEHEGRRYFAGAAHVGQAATLHVGEHEVAIHVGCARVASHPRRPLNGKYSVLPSQRPELLRKRGAQPYAKRQLLMDLCPAAEWILTEIRHRRPQRWTEEVDRLFALLESQGEAAMRDAFVTAARYEAAGAEYVEAVLLGQAAPASASVEAAR
jgi:transposase